MFDSLSGKKVVIIGASSGIDLGIAEKLLSLGAKVVLGSAVCTQYLRDLAYLG